MLSHRSFETDLYIAMSRYMPGVFHGSFLLLVAGRFRDIKGNSDQAAFLYLLGVNTMWLRYYHDVS